MNEGGNFNLKSVWGDQSKTLVSDISKREGSLLDYYFSFYCVLLYWLKTFLVVKCDIIVNHASFLLSVMFHSLLVNNVCLLQCVGLDGYSSGC